MSITPVGGWSAPSQDSGDTYSPAVSEGCCPNCKSDEWQSASLVYNQGLSSTSTRTKGTTVGIGRVGLRDGRFAVGGAVSQSRTFGVQQTVLSKLAAPPQMQTGLMVFLGILCILPALGTLGGITQGLVMQTLLNGSIVGILVLAVSALYEKKRRIYDDAMSKYADTRMCQRCGKFYIARTRPEVKAALPSRYGNLRAVMSGFFILLFVGTVGIDLLRESQAGTDADPNTQRATVSQGSQDLNDTSRSATMKGGLQEPTSSDPSATTKEVIPGNLFYWPTDGLPSYVADVLNGTDLVPVDGATAKIVLGASGESQTISQSTTQCGASSCLWQLKDANGQVMLEDNGPMVIKTAKVTNGYHDLLIQSKWRLDVDEYRNGKYVAASCYTHENFGSKAVPEDCSETSATLTPASTSPKASMGYPVPEEQRPATIERQPPRSEQQPAPIERRTPQAGKY